MEILFVLIALGIVGALIGDRRGHGVQGFFAGFFLGPLGWLLAYCANDDRERCDACRSVIELDARICPHCHSPHEPKQIKKSVWTRDLGELIRRSK